MIVALGFVGIYVTLRGSKKDASEGDELPLVYDPEASARYFEKHPAIVVSRLLELIYRSSGFVLGVIADRRGGGSGANEERRARQCVNLLTRLGPTFVKIGQALSIRVDLLSPAYISQLKTLQDRVPPFPTAVARGIMAEELTGGDEERLADLFGELPPEPVAAASLGQVYRCRLRREGVDVAVKVQRPDVLEGILLDLYLLRLVAPVLKRANRLNSDLVGLVDEWGRRFVDELNYIAEARNGREFTAAMESRGIVAVTAAEVIDEATTRRVLTTRWVEGTRLEDSTADDVSRLCGLALNAYLIMLLDTGTLHADPHPGNLLRTSDGRLCILDWGLVTKITRQQQYALVDYIANLVSEDYSAIPRDLVSLGFVPAGKEADIREAGVVRVLSNVLRQLSAGGGAAKINVDQLAAELQSMTQSYGNLFQIPPYFAYILRAFTVLEGIGLSSDPNYAIVQECYPTLAQRLFVDDNPRTRSALRRLVLTPQGQLNVESMLRLTRNFQRFTASTQGLGGAESEPGAEARAVDRELLSIVFSEEPNYLQEILLEGAAKSSDAVSREAFGRVLQAASAGPLAAVLERQRSVAQALGPLRPFLLPFPLPGELLSSWAPLAAKTEEDEAQLEALRQLLRLAEAELADGKPDQQQALIELLSGVVQRAAPLLPELAPGIRATSLRFQAALLGRAADRLGDPRLREASERLQVAAFPRDAPARPAGQ